MTLGGMMISSSACPQNAYLPMEVTVLAMSRLYRMMREFA